MTSPPIFMSTEAFAGWPPPALTSAGPFAEPLVTLSWGVFAMAVTAGIGRLFGVSV